MKWTVQISPCGRIGERNCEIGATGASEAMRSPVAMLVRTAMAEIQWRMIVPASLRECGLVTGPGRLSETLSGKF